MSGCTVRAALAGERMEDASVQIAQKARITIQTLTGRLQACLDQLEGMTRLEVEDKGIVQDGAGIDITKAEQLGSAHHVVVPAEHVQDCVDEGHLFTSTSLNGCSITNSFTSNSHRSSEQMLLGQLPWPSWPGRESTNTACASGHVNNPVVQAGSQSPRPPAMSLHMTFNLEDAAPLHLLGLLAASCQAAKAGLNSSSPTPASEPAPSQHDGVNLGHTLDIASDGLAVNQIAASAPSITASHRISNATEQALDFSGDLSSELSNLGLELELLRLTTGGAAAVPLRQPQVSTGSELAMELCQLMLGAQSTCTTTPPTIPEHGFRTIPVVPALIQPLMQPTYPFHVPVIQPSINTTAPASSGLPTTTVPSPARTAPPTSLPGPPPISTTSTSATPAQTPVFLARPSAIPSLLGPAVPAAGQDVAAPIRDPTSAAVLQQQVLEASPNRLPAPTHLTAVYTAPTPAQPSPVHVSPHTVRTSRQPPPVLALASDECPGTAIDQLQDALTSLRSLCDDNAFHQPASSNAHQAARPQEPHSGSSQQPDDVLVLLEQLLQGRSRAATAEEADAVELNSPVQSSPAVPRSIVSPSNADLNNKQIDQFLGSPASSVGTQSMAARSWADEVGQLQLGEVAVAQAEARVQAALYRITQGVSPDVRSSALTTPQLLSRHSIHTGTYWRPADQQMAASSEVSVSAGQGSTTSARAQTHSLYSEYVHVAALATDKATDSARHSLQPPNHVLSVSPEATSVTSRPAAETDVRQQTGSACAGSTDCHVAEVQQDGVLSHPDDPQDTSAVLRPDQSPRAHRQSTQSLASWPSFLQRPSQAGCGTDKATSPWVQSRRQSDVPQSGSEQPQLDRQAAGLHWQIQEALRACADVAPESIDTPADLYGSQQRSHQPPVHQAGVSRTSSGAGKQAADSRRGSQVAARDQMQAQLQQLVSKVNQADAWGQQVSALGLLGLIHAWQQQQQQVAVADATTESTQTDEAPLDQVVDGIPGGLEVGEQAVVVVSGPDSRRSTYSAVLPADASGLASMRTTSFSRRATHLTQEAPVFEDTVCVAQPVVHTNTAVEQEPESLALPPSTVIQVLALLKQTQQALTARFEEASVSSVRSAATASADVSNSVVVEGTGQQQGLTQHMVSSMLHTSPDLIWQDAADVASSRWAASSVDDPGYEGDASRPRTSTTSTLPDPTYLLTRHQLGARPHTGSAKKRAQHHRQQQPGRESNVPASSKVHFPGYSVSQRSTIADSDVAGSDVGASRRSTYSVALPEMLSCALPDSLQADREVSGSKGLRSPGVMQRSGRASGTTPSRATSSARSLAAAPAAEARGRGSGRGSECRDSSRGRSSVSSRASVGDAAGHSVGFGASKVDAASRKHSSSAAGSVKHQAAAAAAHVVMARAGAGKQSPSCRQSAQAARASPCRSRNPLFDEFSGDTQALCRSTSHQQQPAGFTGALACAQVATSSWVADSSRPQSARRTTADLSECLAVCEYIEARMHASPSPGRPGTCTAAVTSPTGSSASRAGVMLLSGQVDQQDDAGVARLKALLADALADVLNKQPDARHCPEDLPAAVARAVLTMCNPPHATSPHQPLTPRTLDTALYAALQDIAERHSARGGRPSHSPPAHRTTSPRSPPVRDVYGTDSAFSRHTDCDVMPRSSSEVVVAKQSGGGRGVHASQGGGEVGQLQDTLLACRLVATTRRLSQQEGVSMGGAPRDHVLYKAKEATSILKAFNQGYDSVPGCRAADLLGSLSATCNLSILRCTFTAWRTLHTNPPV